MVSISIRPHCLSNTDTKHAGVSFSCTLTFKTRAFSLIPHSQPDLNARQLPAGMAMNDSITFYIKRTEGVGFWQL